MINITRKRAVVPVFSATVLCFFLLNFLSSHSQQETKANEKESRLRIEESQCPKLSIGECSRWTSNGQEKIVNSWLFNSTDCGQSHNDEIIYVIPEGPSVKRELNHGARNNATSIVFYGSSHIRELHHAFVRLKRGLHYLDQLESNLTILRSGVPTNQLLCDPRKTGFVDGKYGVDLENCGLPGKRVVPELGENVAIGFKTFLHTPEADQIFADWLQAVDLRHPQVLIADVGIWGARGARRTTSLNYSLSLEEEIDYYLFWLRETFPETKLVLIVSTSDGPLHSKLNQFSEHDPAVFLLRKDIVMKGMLPRMACGHGCKGPVLVLLATVLLDWLEVATQGPQRCI